MLKYATSLHGVGCAFRGPFQVAPRDWSVSLFVRQRLTMVVHGKSRRDAMQCMHDALRGWNKAAEIRRRKSMRAR